MDTISYSPAGPDRAMKGIKVEAAAMRTARPKTIGTAGPSVLMSRKKCLTSPVLFKSTFEFYLEPTRTGENSPGAKLSSGCLPPCDRTAGEMLANKLVSHFRTHRGSCAAG